MTFLHGIGVELGEKYFENRFQEFDIEGFLDAWAETQLVGIRNSDRNTLRDRSRGEESGEVDCRCT
jgi:hypothetical protein